MLIRTTAIAVATSLGLAACTPAVVDTSCAAFAPITFSARGDTPETIAQIRAHNAAWERLCR